MSYFNQHQQDYMADLAAMPADQKCACGWFRREECDYERTGIKGHCSRKYLFLREAGVEWIQQAAIMDGETPFAQWSPARHHSLIHELIRMGRPRPITGAQGFLTSTGRFVDRAEARRIAVACGQVDPAKTYNPTYLFSEDVW